MNSSDENYKRLLAAAKIMVEALKTNKVPVNEIKEIAFAAQFLIKALEKIEEQK